MLYTRVEFWKYNGLRKGLGPKALAQVKFAIQTYERERERNSHLIF
jgi:hypothetical protein